MSALLETKNLSKSFGGLQALSDISLEVEEGMICGVIGPNGAGKTTLVNCITGFLNPSQGRVTVGGEDITGRRPWNIAHAGVARTFQIVKPFRQFTVRENVAMGTMFGSQSDRFLSDGGRTDELLHRVGLHDKSELQARDLTVAEARRLELAKGLSMRPRLLFLDEVMAGLRPHEVDDAVRLIHSVRDEGVTVVAIEHVMRAIMAISDIIFVLHEGRELTRGTPEEVASDQRVVEAYLGKRYTARKDQDDA